MKEVLIPLDHWVTTNLESLTATAILPKQKDDIFAEWRRMAHPDSYCCLAGRKQHEGYSSAAVKNNRSGPVGARGPSFKASAEPRRSIESTNGASGHRGRVGVRCELAHGASASATQKLVSCSCAGSVASKLGAA